jgi:glutamyl-tRNA synthetase
VFNWLFARGRGGAFILRIEDTDTERSTSESEASIIRDLHWLGLEWDEGPDIGGACGPYRQSERFHLYASYAKELLASGDAYYCFCSKEQLDADRKAALAEGRTVRYAGTCRSISREAAEARVAAGASPAIRFRVPENRDVVFTDAVRGDMRFHTDVIGDPVIVRAEGTPAYNFAVVVDDALMAITHVIRGEDHLSNTPRQILLYEALGFTAPVFAHLSMVMGPDHALLSKRHGATSVAEFRAKGFLPEALVNYLALIGWSPRAGGSSRAEQDNDELLPASELARRFSIEDVGKSAGVFDEDKLAWVNRHYLKAAPTPRLADLSLPFFAAAGIAMAPGAAGLEFLASAMPIATASVDRLDQVPGRLDFLFDYSPERTIADPVVAAEMRAEAAHAVVRALADVLAAAPRLDREGFRAAANEVKSRTGLKGKALFHPIRVALMGRGEGPELDLAIPAIDRGAELPADAGIPKIVGCRERAESFARRLNPSLEP